MEFNFWWGDYPCGGIAGYSRSMASTSRTSQVFKKCSIAVIAPAFLLGVAACGNDSDGAGIPSDTPKGTATERVDATTPSKTASLSAPEMTVNGNQVDMSTYAPIACVRGEEDGRQDIEYKAGDGGSPGKLEVDLALEPLALTSFELKYDGKEYEMDDAEKEKAEVTEGDKSYTITGTAHQDDGQETIDVKLTVGC